MHGLSLTSPRAAAPACRCPPRHQAPRRLPAAETSQLITRVMPKPSPAPGAQRRRPGRAPPLVALLQREENPPSASPFGAGAGGAGVGTGTGSTANAEPGRTREVICILVVTLGNVCYKCILELFY